MIDMVLYDSDIQRLQQTLIQQFSQENGKVLAVGAGDAAVHVLEVSSSLSLIQPNEKAAIVAVQLSISQHLTPAFM